MKIKVNVHPKSGRQSVIKAEKDYSVYLKSAAEDNKANIELIKLLKKHFGRNIEIKSGFKSRKKTIEVK